MRDRGESADGFGEVGNGEIGGEADALDGSRVGKIGTRGEAVGGRFPVSGRDSMVPVPRLLPVLVERADGVRCKGVRGEAGIASDTSLSLPRSDGRGDCAGGVGKGLVWDASPARPRNT
jgi:hypothetical protein